MQYSSSASFSGQCYSGLAHAEESDTRDMVGMLVMAVCPTVEIRVVEFTTFRSISISDVFAVVLNLSFCHVIQQSHSIDSVNYVAYCGKHAWNRR